MYKALQELKWFLVGFVTLTGFFSILYLIVWVGKQIEARVPMETIGGFLILLTIIVGAYCLGKVFRGDW